MRFSLLAILVCFIVVAYAQEPTKPVWPDQFIATFGLNMNSFSIKNETSTFYSNWQVKAQLVDYPSKCIPYNKEAASQPCKIWFLPAGAYISIPDQKVCCLWFPGVGAVPPDFLTPFNYTDVETAADESGKNHTCNRWDGFGFVYWTEVGTGFDIQFRDGPGDLFWNFGDFTEAPQDPSLFVLPANCLADCPSSVSRDMNLLPLGVSLTREEGMEEDSLLMKAASRGALENVKAILKESRATINDANSKGSTALLIATQQGHLEVVKLLVENGASIHVPFKSAPLFTAVESGHLEIVKFLLEQGASVDAVSKVGGLSPLYYAAIAGNAHIAKLLLENNAKADACCYGGYFPLLAAASLGHVEVANILLDHGADINDLHPEQGTPLCVAAEKGRLEMVKMLLQRGAGVNMSSNAGYTPLYAAESNSHSEVIKLLLDAGAQSLPNVCGRE